MIAFGRIAFAAAGAAAIVGLCAAAPAPPSPPRFPTAVASELGTTRLVGERDLGAPLAGVQVFVAAGLDRESYATSGIAALVAECIARTPVPDPSDRKGPPLPLREAIAAQGGSLDYDVDGGYVHYYLEALPGRLPDLVSLFARALAAPDFSPATIAAARTELDGRIANVEDSALSVGIQMIRQAYYANGTGLPALGTSASLATLGPSRLAAFYHANYVRQAVSASAAGAFAPDLARALSALADGLPNTPPAPVLSRAKPLTENPLRIVARRAVGAPWIVVGFAAPSPSARDFGAMLILQAVLADAFERQSATTLGFLEKSVGAFYLYGSSPASLVVYVNGSETDPTLALRELLLATKTLSKKPLTAATLAHFKAIAQGRFVDESLDLSDRSYQLGSLAAQGLGDDPINAALDSLQAASGADVQRLAKTYLQRFIVALVLPRNEGAGP